MADEPSQSVKLTLRYKREVEPKPLILDGVNFDTAKATIRPESFPRLDTVVDFMVHKKDARVEISGHTDNVGKAKANKTLSEQRAQACRDYIQGVRCPSHVSEPCRMLGSHPPTFERIKRAYVFLTERERNAATFTKEELVAATGWRGGTVTTYLTKKWVKLVKREGRVLRAIGVSGYTMDEFLCLMSQRDEISADPRKPHLKPEVESLLLKARQSALLALQIYNNPTTVFRTEGFSVMMVIAWTALFHAIFEKRGHPYSYLDQATGKPVVVDGDLKAWELGECLKRFYEGTTYPGLGGVPGQETR